MKKTKDMTIADELFVGLSGFGPKTAIWGGGIGAFDTEPPPGMGVLSCFGTVEIGKGEWKRSCHFYPFRIPQPPASGD